MEFKWDAEDTKQGMTADEMIRGLGRAKMVMGSKTRMTLTATVGMSRQIKSVNAKAYPEDLTKISDLTSIESKAQPE